MIAGGHLPEINGMGAIARLFSGPTTPSKPDLARTRATAPRVKSLGLTLMRPHRRPGGVRSLFTILPEEVLLLDEGIAVATYADDGAVQYANLDELLDDHGLVLDDLEIIERVSGLGRWDP